MDLNVGDLFITKEWTRNKKTPAIVIALHDIDLDEFTDEIDAWVIDELKKVGCDTARSVLALTDEELIRRTDLEEETIREVKQVLQNEFEEGSDACQRARMRHGLPPLAN